VKGPNEAYTDLLLEALGPEVTAVGTYSVGLVSGLAWRDGLDPDRILLRIASRASGPRNAIVAYEHWKRGIVLTV
jgi:hypothetical protein